MCVFISCVHHMIHSVTGLCWLSWRTSKPGPSTKVLQPVYFKFLEHYGVLVAPRVEADGLWMPLAFFALQLMAPNKQLSPGFRIDIQHFCPSNCPSNCYGLTFCWLLSPSKDHHFGHYQPLSIRIIFTSIVYYISICLPWTSHEPSSIIAPIIILQVWVNTLYPWWISHKWPN